jgi:hypothetical protein
MLKHLAIALGLGLAFALPASAQQGGDRESSGAATEQEVGGSEEQSKDTYDLSDPDREGFIEGYDDFDKDEDKGLFGDLGDAFDNDESDDDAKDRDSRKSKDSASKDSSRSDLEPGVLRIQKSDLSSICSKLEERGYKVEKSGEKALEDVSDLEPALAKFQKDVGLEESDGELDLATLNALGFNCMVGIHPDVEGAQIVEGQRPIVTEQPAGIPSDSSVVGGGSGMEKGMGVLLLGEDEIDKISDRLRDEGYLQGEVEDGRISQEFVDGLKKFQEAKGIKSAQGGVIDLATLAWFSDLDVDVEVSDRESGSSDGAVAPVPSGSERGGTQTDMDKSRRFEGSDSSSDMGESGSIHDRDDDKSDWPPSETGDLDDDDRDSSFESGDERHESDDD